MESTNELRNPALRKTLKDVEDSVSTAKELKQLQKISRLPMNRIQNLIKFEAKTTMIHNETKHTISVAAHMFIADFIGLCRKKMVPSDDESCSNNLRIDKSCIEEIVKDTKIFDFLIEE